MNPRFLAIPAVALALALPSPAEAQLGAILEWINELSGPGLVRAGPVLTVTEVGDRNTLEVAPLFTFHVDDQGNVDTDAADIGAFGVQAALESTLLGENGPVQLRSRLGFELHRFSGDFDSFWAPGFPAFLAVHVRQNGWGFHVGTGFNLFRFPDDAFDPWDTGVVRDGYDAGWSLQAGVEFGDFRIFDRR